MAKPVVNLPGEIWKPIKDFEGLYEVSDMGRVKSLKRRVPFAGGLRTYNERILSPGVQKYGMVMLCKNATRSIVLVHKLVLEAFAGPRPPGHVCRHLDGDGRNNRRSNLAWGTRVENEADKLRHGTVARGERNGGGSKMTAEKVREVRRLLRHGITQSRIARMYGVSQRLVQKIGARELWKHIED